MGAGYFNDLLDMAYRVVKFLRPLAYIIELIKYNYIFKKEPLAKFILNTINRKENLVIYDIGANNGIYSLCFAKRSKSQIYAFEPNPEAYRRLVHNINLFDIKDRVRAENFALGEKNEKRLFHIASSYAFSTSSFHEFNARCLGDKIVKSITVDCYTIDYLVEQGLCPPPQIIKLDVEGYEPEVIKGALNTLKKHKPVIFFEPHDMEGGSNLMEITGLLEELGYKCTPLPYPKNPVYCSV